MLVHATLFLVLELHTRTMRVSELLSIIRRGNFHLSFYLVGILLPMAFTSALRMEVLVTTKYFNKMFPASCIICSADVSSASVKRTISIMTYVVHLDKKILTPTEYTFYIDFI